MELYRTVALAVRLPRELSPLSSNTNPKLSAFAISIQDQPVLAHAQKTTRLFKHLAGSLSCDVLLAVD